MAWAFARLDHFIVGGEILSLWFQIGPIGYLRFISLLQAILTMEDEQLMEVFIT